MPAHYEIFEDEEGAFRWRLVAANGEIVSQSEAYTTKSDASRGALDAQKVSEQSPEPE